MPKYRVLINIVYNSFIKNIIQYNNTYIYSTDILTYLFIVITRINQLKIYVGHIIISINKAVYQAIILGPYIFEEICILLIHSLLHLLGLNHEKSKYERFLQRALEINYLKIFVMLIHRSLYYRFLILNIQEKK